TTLQTVKLSPTDDPEMLSMWFDATAGDGVAGEQTFTICDIRFIEKAVTNPTPTATPTEAPSENPTDVPSEAPSGVPTDVPSEAPSGVPTDVPSEVPSGVPTDVPSEVPSGVPTDVPSEAPSGVPSEVPSDVPTGEPTEIPSGEPTVNPSGEPTEVPTTEPSSSPEEKIRAYVDRLYRLCMDREADEEGFNFWINALKNGDYNGCTICDFFIYSPEFTAKNLSDEEYVKVLYRVMMDREYDEGGLEFWLGYLKSGVGRDGVLNGFLTSNEYKGICDTYGITLGTFTLKEYRSRKPELTRFLSRLYSKALEREYDVDGLNHWSEQILTGKMDIMTVCTFGFFETDEFLSKNYNDDQYLDHLYATFFDREGDEGGLNYWRNELKYGKSRTAVLADFAYSLEFKKIKASFGL
ncbi:MAG: DUF4214 domain-containing protein, partial [Lachnospiraceae bacterium]|nr:DUF4214 domain-containing protein [Lachnospiraceae bacterium]